MANKTDSNKSAVAKLRELFYERKKRKVITPEIREIFKKRPEKKNKQEPLKKIAQPKRRPRDVEL